MTFIFSQTSSWKGLPDAGRTQQNGIPTSSQYFPADGTPDSVWQTSKQKTISSFQTTPPRRLLNPRRTTCLDFMFSAQRQQTFATRDIRLITWSSFVLHNLFLFFSFLHEGCRYSLSGTIWPETEKPWSAYSHRCITERAGGGLPNASQLRWPLATAGSHDPICVLSNVSWPCIEHLELRQHG